MKVESNGRWSSTIIFLQISIAVSLVKIWLACKFHSFDFLSYCIVSTIVGNGDNVYATTDRYNYGPPWFLILGALGSLTDNNTIFRLLIVALLCLADFLVALLIGYLYGLNNAQKLMLNPAIIVSSGILQQFEALAMIPSILCIMCYEKYETKNFSKSWLLVSCLLLGISLTIKHFSIFLPLVLLMRKKPSIDNLYFIAPYLIFFASFVPYLDSNSFNGIQRNVIGYCSLFGTGITGILLNQVFNITTAGELGLQLLIVVSILVGHITRKIPAGKVLIIYWSSLIAFSPSISGQYFTLAYPFAAVILKEKQGAILNWAAALSIIGCYAYKLPYLPLQLLLVIIMLNQYAKHTNLKEYISSTIKNLRDKKSIKIS